MATLPPRPRVLGPLLLSAALTAGLDVAMRELPPRPEEPAWLRWARVAAGHPVRTGLAVALLVAAVRAPRLAADSVDPAAAARAGDVDELG